MCAMGKPFVLGVSAVSTDPLGDASREGVAEEMTRIAGLGLGLVRILLPWKDLQPQKTLVSDRALRRVEAVLDEARRAGLRVLPVFFCGRLGSVNWLPGWMCESYRPLQPLDFYGKGELMRAQQTQVSVVAGAFSKHEAVAGWDLGRETSSLVPAPDADAARSRMLRLLEALKREDESHRVTFTLSQCDLEQDRGVRPAGIAEELDFLSVQAAPAQASWSEGPDDAEAAGFLCALTCALSARPVLLAELNVSGSRREDEAYIELSLEKARQAGALGALVWAFRDWPAENISGLVQENGAMKLEGEAFSRFVGRAPECVEASTRLRWDEESFYDAPEERVREAYAAYRMRGETDEGRQGADR